MSPEMGGVTQPLGGDLGEEEWETSTVLGVLWQRGRQYSRALNIYSILASTVVVAVLLGSRLLGRKGSRLATYASNRIAIRSVSIGAIAGYREHLLFGKSE